MDGIYLLLGTNLGDKFLQLKIAKRQINEQIGTIVRQSSIYKTAAWGEEDQDSFLNQVVKVQSKLGPLKILDKIAMIEGSMGRERRGKWKERIIDIDILYYHDQVITTEKLHIPHRELQNRNFALAPLAEIASGEIHPVFQKTQKELYEQCADQLEVIMLPPEHN